MEPKNSVGPAETSLCAVPHRKKSHRQMHQRVFVNRSLHLDKIKFFGFDMDYTLAEYKTPVFEAVSFEFAKNKLIEMGYPSNIRDFKYDSSFPIRGLWFDTHLGNLLKVDAYGNILVCVSGFRFLKTSEIYVIYPNKFVQLDESRIYVLNTLFAQPETYLLACVNDYFLNSKEYEPTERGVKKIEDQLYMSFQSIFQDVRNAFDWIHVQGTLKQETINNLPKYVHRDERLPMLFKRMREHGKKIFLLTNSDYMYTQRIMAYLFEDPNKDSTDWKAYFDYILVDAKKPLFFGEGTILRQVDVTTGALKIGNFFGPIKSGQVYSGGSCDVFTQLIGAKGRDVLYVGDHIYGDILKSKKTRGWRTFLVVPELQHELCVWNNKKELFDRLTQLDTQLGDLYKNLDSTSVDKPDISQVNIKIRETIHELDMSYGILGSIFRCGSRTTHFATQICRYADIYASSFINLIYYPFSYMFRAPPMLMSHEIDNERSYANGIYDIENGFGEEKNGIINNSEIRRPSADQHTPSNVPHLYAEIPQVVTHHHDTDDEESSQSGHSDND